MTNIVRQLLDGSEALNQMKKEIDAIVKMVVGMVRESDIMRWKYDHDSTPTGRLREVFHSDDCEWEIAFNDERKFDVECRLIGTICKKGDVMNYVYSTRRQGIELCYIQEVHRCLPVFIEKMAEAFPNLKERWQPLLDAAPNH